MDTMKKLGSMTPLTQHMLCLLIQYVEKDFLVPYCFLLKSLHVLINSFVRVCKIT